MTRIIRKKLRSEYAFMRHPKSKYRPARYQYWVRKKECYLDVGIENTSKGAESAWWADQQELGTNGQPKKGFLRSAVYDNLDKIREIEAHYLSAIETADDLINEDEMRGDASEDD